MGKIEISFCVPVFAAASPYYEAIDYPSIRAAVLECERLGYSSVWAPDHLILGQGNSILEGWTTLSALASITEKMRLGTLVLCNAHRHPSLVAKMAATLDVISGGRFTCGIGAGWYENELVSYGLPWDKSAALRIQKMEEALEVIKRMWTQDRASYEGRYYRIREAVCEPKPLQKPHPPIWIGGGGERLLLRTVAKYADGWNIPAVTPEDYAHKLEVLEKHCLEVGRDFGEIEKTLENRILISQDKNEIKRVVNWLESFYVRIFPGIPATLRPHEKLGELYILGNLEECTQKIGEYVDAGVEHLTLYFLDFPSLKSVRLLAEEVMPSL